MADYVAKCSICQQVQVEHRKPVGLLQPLPIPKWKWEMVTMDFVSGPLSGGEMIQSGSLWID